MELALDELPILPLEEIFPDEADPVEALRELVEGLKPFGLPLGRD